MSRAATIAAFEAGGCALDDGLAFQPDDAVERLALAWERAGRPAAKLAVEFGPDGRERLVLAPRRAHGAPAAPGGAPAAPAGPPATSVEPAAEPFSPW